MFKKISYFFISFLFLLSFLAEANEAYNFSENESQQITNSYSTVTYAIISTTSCDDCQESDCGDTDNHCSHHCSGIHSLVLTNYKISQSNPSDLTYKMSWYFYNHYKPQFIDPDLRPPQYS